jgi:hypothetical protein
MASFRWDPAGQRPQPASVPGPIPGLRSAPCRSLGSSTCSAADSPQDRTHHLHRRTTHQYGGDATTPLRPASFEQGIGGLADCKRPGRPRTFPDVVAAEGKAIACELPAPRGVPISRWSLTELRAKIIGCGLVEAVSTTTLGRWLAEAALRPWRHRSWILPRDPDLAAKAGRVLDLYQRTFQGQSLRGNDYVICADEKSSIQARCRCHPTLPAGQGSMRVEHEYDRGGALAYLAA